MTHSYAKTILRQHVFKQLLLYILLVFQITGVAQSVSSSVSGTVVDEAGLPLIGVNVVVDGTTLGTITDIDGKFILEVSPESSLKVSYIGYKTQILKVDNQKTLHIVLKSDNEMLDEVVVTALGIKRETKSLTYNVQELKSSTLTQVKDANLLNSLTGKIAGVTINPSASGIGGSSRVVMRGTKSLFGDNNALYVIDGIPMMSMRTEQTEQYYENPDGGDSDAISSLNPEDIESVSVLTGAASAALYGTQGANGVILITTKKGQEGKLRVNYTNDTQFMSPFIMPEFQNTYGSVKGSYTSWGDKLDTPTSFDPKDFFQTGYVEANSLSLSLGNSHNQTYASVSSNNSRGIMPNNTYNRYNLTIRNTTDLLEDKLTLDLGASYILTDSKNMLGQGQYHNPLIPLYLFPRGDDFDKYKAYERYNAERNFLTQFWPYGEQDLSMQNPYWIVNREKFMNKKHRYMYTVAANYKPLDWLSLSARMRIDNSIDRYQRMISASSSLLFASENGNYMDQRTEYKNTYGDFIARIEKTFGDFRIDSNIGASFTHQRMDLSGYEGNLLTVPNLFTYSNIDRNGAQTFATQKGYTDENQGVFMTFQLGYKSWAFLDLTGRNDWYSSLANTDSEKKGFFYYSTGLSAVLTEMFDLSETPLSFMKLRASYSEVGNAPQRGITSLSYPISGGVIETLPNIPATFLKPERTKAVEFGTNIRLFKDLINLDVTYYNSNTFNQFYTFVMPPSSGYKQFYINGGKVNNWGIEASLGIKKQFKDFQFSSNVTFTMNRNEIKELLPEDTKNPVTGELMNVTEMEPFEPQGSYKMLLKKGGTMGDIYVTGLVQDEQGHILVNAGTGKISRDDNKWIKAGSTTPRFNWGWNNNLSYKGLNLSFLITARIGGVGVSATQALMDRYGVSQASAEARDRGGAYVNGELYPAQTYYEVVGSGHTGVLSQYVYSMTNIRLQEMTLGYTFPKKWFNNKIDNLTVSLIGKNLLMLYHKAPFDPEITASTSTYYQGFDYFMQPSLRTFGFSLKFQY